MIVELKKPFYYSKTIIKLLLLGCLIYGCLPFSVNPNQRASARLFDYLEYFYFTNIALYATIIIITLGMVARYTRKFVSVYERSLSLVASANMITSFVFWTLYFINKSLIVGEKALEPGCETYLLTELSIHLFPLILVLVEQLDLSLHHKANNIYFFILFNILFMIDNQVFKILTGKNLYGFLNHMSVVWLVAFHIGITILSISFYFLYLAVNRVNCLYLQSKLIRKY